MRKIFSRNGILVKGILFVMVFFMAFAAMPGYMSSYTAYAADDSSGYGSWVRDKSGGVNISDTLEGDGIPLSDLAAIEKEIPEPEKGKVGWIESHISELIVDICNFFVWAMKKGKVDGSVTGIIMGYLTNGSGTSIFVFDLTDDNVYGLFGAVLYVICRTLTLCFLFLLVLKELISCMLLSDSEAYAEMKKTVYSAFITFMLIFLMPQIVDWVCTARNAVALYLYQKIWDSGIMGDGSEEMMHTIGALDVEYYTAWKNHESIPNAIVYFMASVAVPLVYTVSYFKIAITQTILFGVYPVFAMCGLKSKGTHSKWIAVFATNCFVPVIDMAILYMPWVVMMKIDTDMLASGFLKSVIIMAIFLSVVPVRNQLLNMLGNAFGMPLKGMGGLQLAGAALKAFNSAVGSAFSGGMGKAGGGAGGGDAAGQKQESDRVMSELGKKADNPVEGSASQKEASQGPDTSEQMKNGTAAEDPVKSQSEAESDRLKEEQAVNAMNGTGESTESTEEARRESDQDAEEMARMTQQRAEFEQGVENQSEQADGASPVNTEQYQAPQDVAPPPVEGPDEPVSQGGNEMNNDVKTAGAGELPEGAPYNPESQPVDEIPVSPVKEENELAGHVDSSIKDEIISSAQAAQAGVSSDSLKAKAEAAMNNERVKLDDPIASRAADVLGASRGMDKRAGIGKAGKDKNYDPQRYENFNMNRLSNLEAMGQHRAQITKVDQAIAHERTAIAASNKAISDNNAKIATLSKDKSMTHEERDAAIDKLTIENTQHEAAISTSGAHIAQYNEARTVLQSNITQCQTRESHYARVMDDRGMAGNKPYKDAQGFANDMKYMKRAQNAATYKNFNAYSEKGYLTPEDRLRFERSERLHRVASATGKAVGSAALLGAAAVVGVAGGEEGQREFINFVGKHIVPGGGGHNAGNSTTVINNNNNTTTDNSAYTDHGSSESSKRTDSAKKRARADEEGFENVG